MISVGIFTCPPRPKPSHTSICFLCRLTISFICTTKRRYSSCWLGRLYFFIAALKSTFWSASAKSASSPPMWKYGVD